MKLIVNVNELNLEAYLESGADGFFLPLKDYATDYFVTFTKKEILETRKKYPDTLLYVVMNEMIFNHDIEDVTQILKELDSYQFDGVVFYDFALYEIQKKSHLSIPLIYHGTHLLTNKEVPDFLFKKGISSCILSHEITLDEIKEIVKSPMPFFITLVGLLPAGVSRRKLLSYFYQRKNQEKQEKTFLKESSTQIPLIAHETEKSTSFLYGKRLNLAAYFPLLSKIVAYGILRQDDLEKEEFLQVLSLYKNEKDSQKRSEKTAELIGRNTGFLMRKTIFKVKK